MIRAILLLTLAAVVLFTAACGDGSQTATPSPPTGRIAFESDRDGGEGDIYVMNADGTNVTRLTNRPEHYDNSPAWSPDGRQIVYKKTV